MPLDLRSLFFATIDFDNDNKMFQTSLSKNAISNYPPYNILKLNQELYRISLALAGFSKKSIEIFLEDNVLCIRNIAEKNNNNYEYLYKGIANRSFEKKFQIADNVKVENAFFENGLLNIDLVKIKREKKQLLRIKIQDND